MWTGGNSYILLVGMYISPTIVEISMGAPQNADNRLSYDPAIPHLSIYAKGFKSTVTETHIQQCVLQHCPPELSCVTNPGI